MAMKSAILFAWVFISLCHFHTDSQVLFVFFLPKCEVRCFFFFPKLETVSFVYGCLNGEKTRFERWVLCGHAIQKVYALKI